MKPWEPSSPRSSSSSSFPSPLPSSSPPKDWDYDVFLNFRGEDTRHGFTDHLYAALDGAGIRTFRDAEGLRRGEDIEQKLMQIIEECRISLIVFSKRYGDSRWCLHELVKIMECRRTRGQLVFPIFYHVDPSDVRHRRRSFAMTSLGKWETSLAAFNDLREAAFNFSAGGRSWSNDLREAAFNFSAGGRSWRWRNDGERSWRNALREAASLSGWHLGIDVSEVETIKCIVKQVRSGLNTTYLKEAKYPVGIVQHVEVISKCLDDVRSDNNDVRMVGIWGMAGIGKTAVAKAIYNKFYHGFDSRSFLEDVRETAKGLRGLTALQESLLSDVLKPTKIEVGKVDIGINVIKQQLGRKKVLVIFDDVNDQEQLDALACERDSFGQGSFGQGSIIIITTRDRLLLQQLQVHLIYPIREMPEGSALELFSRHAFRDLWPPLGFSDLSRSVVAYCGGLPLALEVLGSFFFGKEKGAWKCTLDKLKRFPDAKIQSRLRISYDAMDWNQKEIFLHISCFLIGMDKNHAIQILEGCDLSAESDISVLLHRSLLTVSEKNKLMMHDLLRDMGREVVRLEFPALPEKRSRLWHQADIIDVLTEDSGTKKTQGLALNWLRSDKSSFSTESFGKMRLKLLQLNYVQLTGDCDKFAKKLRWLCLRGFSKEIIRNEFLNGGNLVSIDLRYSNLVRVWEYSEELKTLKILNLSHSHNLTQSPDFSNLPNLEYLILKDCKSLSEIHESVGRLERLAVVNLKGCIMLKDLPKSFYELQSVKTLVLSGCSGFANLDEDIGNMISLRTLLVNGTSITEIPSSVQTLLPRLDFSSRDSLKQQTTGPSHD
ncbi:putative TIR domain, P-loop containing nucleoside triphosphate hydrolase [Rosa chinensis]|uniref:Putative TIR domain, P-loop containing nucleoside triphosphate hydrolase n=1 Tax=Rosa chinensis TaxID=74649 RepID=A0A2P6PGA5_ROSCH|nr:disease resistance protein RPV1 [Rosa chinensis]XP_024174227.1 disease resistance protein RPV1 [Rosa chinensis]XP_040366389.1 disease resistance protein RPV1 [Rosa chinensis]XP_040366390.1 disease resistance protein RPV1 [Rosa chinensis]XP_040366391.1 disease resistance protein RPV1 [Rosa chinensis]XP_040366392.1 disease resistance protein RPV1 [Rosa chinensis]XP_040366393.1 disease resistance protein RPV1 [Rosa chinensis]XP_040366394.1 disease resistance protein RPV1 [Rosa chinensis]XP_